MEKENKISLMEKKNKLKKENKINDHKNIYHFELDFSDHYYNKIIDILLEFLI
jgi:hypothetical protein